MTWGSMEDVGFPKVDTPSCCRVFFYNSSNESFVCCFCTGFFPGEKTMAGTMKSWKLEPVRVRNMLMWHGEETSRLCRVGRRKEHLWYLIMIEKLKLKIDRRRSNRDYQQLKVLIREKILNFWSLCQHKNIGAVSDQIFFLQGDNTLLLYSTTP